MSEYGKILTALRANQTNPHPEPELLSRYAVERCEPGERDYDGRGLTPDQLTSIDSHLGGCDVCREYANHAIGDYREVDAYLQGQGLPEVLPRDSPPSVIERFTTFWRGLSRYGTLAYASGAAMAIFVLG